jgi:3',5'-cyclic-AMP phosphodiesterase
MTATVGPVIVQLSDVHIGSRLARRGSTPGAELRRAIDAVASLDVVADLVLVTGDLVDHGREEEYDELLDVLDDLAQPFVLVAGNHDDPAALARVVERRMPEGAPLRRVVDLGAVRVLLLDSSVPGWEAGRVGQAQCAWLDGELAADTRPTIVAVHHPPMAVGHAGLDRMRLVDADALGHVIARHRHVERIVCGHVHRAITARWCDTIVTTAPSCIRQFAPTFGPEPSFGVTNEAPAFLVHVWVDGALASHVFAI